MDGKEVFKSSIFDVFKLEQEIEHRMDEQYPGLTGRDRWSKENEQLITEGAASEHAFYYAFREYDTQSIEKSLESKYALVRVLAILDRRVGKRRLDRRVGKRRLAAIKERGFDGEPEWVQFFYRLRLEAEGL